MNLRENINEGLRSIKANILRASLTAMIVALGIMALVGILTTIDGMQHSVDSSFAGLGMNSFDIKVESFSGRRRGVQSKPNEPISYFEAKRYQTLMEKEKTTVSVYTSVSSQAEVKYASRKTNPNTQIMGGDQNYVPIKGYKIKLGRNITENDVLYSSRVVVLGSKVAQDLFQQESPLDKEISILEQKCRVIGVLEEKGSMNGGGENRIALLPIEVGRQFAGETQLSFDVTTAVFLPSEMDYKIGKATSAMRMIRKDRIGASESFYIERSDDLAKNFEEVTDYLKIGAFAIGFVTLLGASIALMNIMMVSVTERTREIGIRKALGACPQKIRLQFLIEAIVICVLGGSGGVLLGIVVGNIVSQLISESNGFIMPWAWMILGLVVCFLVGIISGYYPAVRASKMDPIESLRYE